MVWNKLKYGVICLSIILVATAYFFMKMAFEQSINVSQSEEFVVRKGSSASQVLGQLENRQIIYHTSVIKLLFKFDPSYAHIKSGTYQLNSQQTFLEFWQTVMRGDEINYQITLIEGLTWKQWLSVISQHPKLEQDINETALLAQIPLPSMEGQLLPETYVFRAGMKATELVTKAYQDMQEFLNEKWTSRDANLALTTPYEALIMASIIEKETALNNEMPKISGVFNNRLKQNMRLQTDPTVIYGLGEEFDGNITRKHLRTPTPYNTYTIYGLPPTPIAMPSKKAIIAALNPEPTEALFFVAKGDGSHYFSASLAEHNAAVKKYQLGQE